MPAREALADIVEDCCVLRVAAEGYRQLLGRGTGTITQLRRPPIEGHKIGLIRRQPGNRLLKRTVNVRIAVERREVTTGAERVGGVTPERK